MFQVFSSFSLVSKPPFHTLFWDAGAATLQTTFWLGQLAEKDGRPCPPACFLLLEHHSPKASAGLFRSSSYTQCAVFPTPSEPASLAPQRCRHQPRPEGSGLDLSSSRFPNNSSLFPGPRGAGCFCSCCLLGASKPPFYLFSY